MHAGPDQHGVHILKRRKNVFLRSFIAVIDPVDLPIFASGDAIERESHAQD